MKRILIIVIFLIQLHENLCTNNCNNKTSEYSEYKSCVREENYCVCDNEVDDCNDTCQELYPRCFRTCHMNCRTTVCRRSCRQKCKEPESEPTSVNHTILNPPYNTTTIVKLQNVVNTTNNNYFPELKPQISQIAGNGQSPRQSPTNTKSCCNVVGPTTCEKQPEKSREPKFPGRHVSNSTASTIAKNCNYNITQECGDMCLSQTVHKEKYNPCSTAGGNTVPQNCLDSFYYIPQPQPRCFPTFAWPYVSCRPYQQQFCGGCYSHYFDQTASFFKYCPSSCYDEGYNEGPIYRQGPFYRPGYSHAPPCFIFGTCGTPDNPYVNLLSIFEDAFRQPQTIT